MATATGNYPIPYSRKTGEPLSYAASWDDDIDWRPNSEFEAVMRAERIYSGRSAKGIILIHKDGREFPMFMTDFLDAVRNNSVRAGWFSGRWKFRKRGMNYGVVFLGE